ncbi:MAG TPA: DUF3305 domain-containing protein [Pseudolabrys sp.]|nr:DUF3305 domain-containing protein [Pseudolabrys sp.]
MTAPLSHIPVGVVIERRRTKSEWLDVIWLPVAVLSGLPDAAPWTVLSSDEEASMFYAGAADIELYRSETGNYRDNLSSGIPSVWISLQATGGDPPYRIAAVTVDPAEGESLTEAGSAIVEAVAMPESVREAIAAFVSQYHVETVFHKRKRDRADPEAMARREPHRGNDDDRS